MYLYIYICVYISIWYMYMGFPKIRGTFLRVPNYKDPLFREASMCIYTYIFHS